MLTFICYPKCTTCQKAQAWLDQQGVEYTLRNIKEDNPSYDELAQWYGISGLPLRKFFNTSGLLYKSLALKDKLPTMSEEEYYAYMDSFLKAFYGEGWEYIRKFIDKTTELAANGAEPNAYTAANITASFTVIIPLSSFLKISTHIQFNAYMGGVFTNQAQIYINPI